MNSIHNSWLTFIKSQQNQEYYRNLSNFVNQQRLNFKVFPTEGNVLKAFEQPLSTIKCVILGQDPYHQTYQAMGLAFSVPRHIAIPPSLRNIFKELNESIPNIQIYHGDLSSWSNQGVFLLNTILTVQKDKPLSHSNQGWEIFTLEAIKFINSQLPHVVFILWGKNAQSFQPIINSKHTVLLAPHPSPLSAHRGFLGCNHFNLCNQALLAHNQLPINWNIPL